MSTKILVDIIRTAEKKFNITAPKPYQILVMHRILEQENSSFVRNQIVILPTGIGKSLCFQIPATLCRGITVVVYPLLALMNDQKNSLKRAGISFAEFRGGQTKEQRLKEKEKLRNGTKIVITNPETLTQKSVLKVLSEFKISLFVCDEAHVIEQWGAQFRPKYMELSECVKKLKPHQILAFTATADEKTLKVIKSVLFKGMSPLVVRGNIDRENIFYRSVMCLDKLYGLRKVLDECQKPAIVFCGTRNLAYRLCMRSLRTNRGIPMRYYHAGLSSKERETIEKWFMNSTDGVLFATCAYGLGVSKNNIRSVVHYTLPTDVLEYLQESGRAGRDRQEATAYVLIDSKPKTDVEKVFTDNKCRRSALLEIMGQQNCECAGCDWCCGETAEPVEKTVIERIVRKRTFVYTPDDLPWILGRERDFRFVRDGFELDPYFRALGNMNYDEISRSVEHLVKDEVLGRCWVPGKVAGGDGGKGGNGGTGGTGGNGCNGGKKEVLFLKRKRLYYRISVLLEKLNENIDKARSWNFKGGKAGK